MCFAECTSAESIEPDIFGSVLRTVLRASLCYVKDKLSTALFPFWSCQTFLVVHQPDLQNHVHDIYLKPKSFMPENLICVSIEMAGSYITVQIFFKKQ